MNAPITESRLADGINQKIRNGRLPEAMDGRVFTGRGSGFPCACCGRSIGPAEAEYEIEFSPLDANSLCVMHRRCYLIWSTVVCRMEREAEYISMAMKKAPGEEINLSGR